MRGMQKKAKTERSPCSPGGRKRVPSRPEMPRQGMWEGGGSDCARPVAPVPCISRPPPLPGWQDCSCIFPLPWPLRAKVIRSNKIVAVSRVSCFPDALCRIPMPPRKGSRGGPRAGFVVLRTVQNNGGLIRASLNWSRSPVSASRLKGGGSRPRVCGRERGQDRVMDAVPEANPWSWRPYESPLACGRVCVCVRPCLCRRASQRYIGGLISGGS